jgi:hypothetical protein
MAHLIEPLNRPFTDQQIAAAYALAEKFKVGLSLDRDTPSPTRDSFTWMIEGSGFRVVRFAWRVRCFGDMPFQLPRHR